MAEVGFTPATAVAELRAIKGKNTFCGPAAMASVLGITTDHAARVLRTISCQPRITAVTASHLVQALRHFGVQLNHTHLREHYACLTEWLHARRTRFPAEPVILAFGTPDSGHFGVVSGDLYQCNITGSPVPFDAIPLHGLNGIVYDVIEVLGQPVLAPPDERVIARRVLAKARRIAGQTGVVIETMGGSNFRVWCPELDHDDPFEGENDTCDAQTVLQLVERYRHCLENGYLEAVTDPCFL